MVTYRQLKDANPAMFHQSAAAWKDWADSALEHAGYLNNRVGQHITEPHWAGLASALARGKVADAHVNLSASAGQLRTVETVLTQAGQDFEEAHTTSWARRSTTTRRRSRPASPPPSTGRPGSTQE